MGEAHPVSIRDHKECEAGIAENRLSQLVLAAPMLPSPRRMSAGARRDWMLKLWLQGPDLGREQGLALQRQSEGTGVWSSPNLRCVQDAAQVCHNSPIVDAL